MIKRIIGVMAFILMATASLSAQDVFFSTTEGQKLLYANLNAKGKVDSYTEQIIQKVTGSGSNLTIEYTTMAFDKKRIPTGIAFPLTIKIVNGIMEVDLKSMAEPGTEGIVQITGDPIKIPSSLKPGDKLDDVTYNMKVLWVDTQVTVTEQECLTIEEVKVPVGTFTCHKLTQTSIATAGKRSLTSKTITWYTPGIGTIKQEIYNDKNKLQSSMVLEKIE